MTIADTKYDYLEWLEAQLHTVRQPVERYWGLTNLMFEREFDSPIAMDHNRLVDGLDLRVDWFNTMRIKKHEIHYPCSFLEVLIGLSRRMAFVAGGSAPEWAAQLLRNLEVQDAFDPLTRSKQNHIQEVMDKVINRTYSPDGTGGFFPLAWPDRDQREVELWHQLNAFVEERHPEYT